MVTHLASACLLKKLLLTCVAARLAGDATAMKQLARTTICSRKRRLRRVQQQRARLSNAHRRIRRRSRSRNAACNARNFSSSVMLLAAAMARTLKPCVSAAANRKPWCSAASADMGFSHRTSHRCWQIQTESLLPSQSIHRARRRWSHRCSIRVRV